MDREISFYKNFKCLADKCPDTCCRGWEILVDDATAKEIAGCKDLSGHIKEKDGDFLIKQRFGKCHFETREGLCDLEKSGRQNFMPLVCREYPRRKLGIGQFTEMTMELACPEAARLFIEETLSGNLKMVPVTNVNENEKHPVIWTMGNDDGMFLDFLVASRQEILSLCDDKEKNLFQKEKQILAYVEECYQRLMRDDLDGVLELKLGSYVYNSDANFVFYPFDKLDKIITEELFVDNLRWNNRKLHTLIKGYHNIFDKLTAQEATRVVNQAVEHIMSVYKDILDKYTGYFKYVLMEMYLTTYENYCITRPVQQAIIYTQLLIVMDCVEYITSGDLSVEAQVKVLGSLERRVRHSESLTESIFQILR